MGKTHLITGLATFGLALTLAGCANDGGLLGSGATETSSLAASKPRVDASCAPLSQKIDELRRDGVADRVEQAAQGKGTTVNVKRDSLVKIAELNKANADFQQKCSAYRPAPGAAKAATLTPGAGDAAVTKTAAVAPKAAAAQTKTAAADGAKAAADGAKAAVSKASAPAKKAAPPPIEDTGEAPKKAE